MMRSRCLMTLPWVLVVIVSGACDTPSSRAAGSGSQLNPGPQGQGTRTKAKIDELWKQWHADRKIDQQEWRELRQVLPHYFRAALLELQISLGMLGYGTGPFDGVLDEKTSRALARYQKNSGLAPTGELDHETVLGIRADARAASSRAVLLPHYSFFDLDGYFSARGTFVIEGQTQGIPQQTSKIECFRRWNACIDSTALLEPPIGGTDHGGLLSIETEIYDVERWDKHEIVTKPNDLQCVRYTMRINRTAKTVTRLRSTTNSKGACEGVEQSDLRLTLVDGFDLYEKQARTQDDINHRLIQADWKALEPEAGK